MGEETVESLKRSLNGNLLMLKRCQELGLEAELKLVKYKEFYEFIHSFLYADGYDKEIAFAKIMKKTRELEQQIMRSENE